MSQSPILPDETKPPEPEKNRGLEDPRVIHPSPEVTFPEPGELPLAESSPEADSEGRDEDDEPGDDNPGIVDPRNETIGPNIQEGRQGCD